MPKVSIIIPVYNAEKAIERCVMSILKQEYKDFELLLMDDGSKDNSPQILDELAKKDERIRVVHKPNSGVSNTRNLAISLAQGEYLQFLDADDWMSSNATKELVRAMEENQVDLVVADFYRVVGDNLAKKGSIELDQVLTLKEFAQYMMDSPADYYYGVVWNKLYKKEIIDKYQLQMDPNLSFCEDFIFNLEYYLHCKTIYPLQVPVYYYVKTEGSLVSQNTNLSSIYHMKVNVFQYYDKFFKEVLNEEEYRQERLEIAKFYVKAARDEFAIPLLSGTKKVGEESIPVYFSEKTQVNLPIVFFYTSKVYQRYLNTIADKHNLELKDIIVLDTVYRSKERSLKSIEDYTGLSVAQIMIILQKLSFKGYVSLINEIELTDKVQEICEELEQATKDLEQLCVQGLNQQELEVLDSVIGKVSNNLKTFLK